MWNRVMKLIVVLTLIGGVWSYVNNEHSYSQNKESYVNHKLARFRQQLTTVRPRTLHSYHRHQQYQNLFTTETPRFDNSEHHKFRHTRFHKMDGLLSKISRLDTETKATPTSPQRWTSTRSPFVKTTTEAPEDDFIYDNYDDDDAEEEDTGVGSAKLKRLQDIHDGVSASWDSETDDDEDEEDDDEDDGWQAEEATTAMPSLTEYKWRHYGTRGRVEESRRARYPPQSNDYSEITAAVQHALRMNREGNCKVPKARVVSVQHLYPDMSKTYIPHCTVLHQCGDDAGCCRSESLTCAAKNTSKVELFFYTTTYGVPGNKVEKLAFFNHTECECISRREANSREQISETKHHIWPGLTLRTAPETVQPPPETIKRCRCPDLYTPRSSQPSHCRCDCDVGNRDCIRIRRGKEYFSLKDRLCIKNGDCGNPVCEFGSYMRNLGRCPKKQEKFNHFSRGTLK